MRTLTKMTIYHITYGKGIKKRIYSKHYNVPMPTDLSKIILIQDNLSEQEAFDIEMEFIQQYGRQNNNTGILLNKTSGGGRGRKTSQVCSDETRAKLKAARANQIFTPEQIAKAAQSRVGLKRSEEAIAKTAMANRGRKNSEQSLAKFKEANTGTNNPQFGKIWINNKIVNKLVTKEVFQSDYSDWTLGRIMKHNASGQFIFQDSLVSP